MSGIQSKNTKPEMLVRRYLHAQGFRYRLHTRELSGSPDLVLPKYRVVIFVHGCFWHRHAGCRFATQPTSNTEQWKTKFQSNLERDAKNVTALQATGWSVLVVWECELKREPLDRLQRLASEITQQTIDQPEFIKLHSDWSG